MVEQTPHWLLEDILTEKQTHHVLKESLGKVPWELKGSEIRPAVDGIAGFLGDHLKVVLHVKSRGELMKVPLFIKRIPACNKPKAEFIDEHHYFRREELMYKVLETIWEDGPHPWCVRAYIYTDSIIVMPDLSFEGYSPRHYLDTLDTEHVYLTTASIARFHAAFVNYETKKSIDLNRPYKISQDFSEILIEPTFSDSPWLRACSKLSVNILKRFSNKSYSNLPHLEAKLTALYIQACNELKEYDETLNVLLHKDLWVNNILFKHDKDVADSAILIDFQCLRYGPPGFDMMIFLYLTTDRSFRDKKERDVLEYYFKIFANNLNEDSKKRLKDLGYDKVSFLEWCERARMFSMLDAIAIYPYILMDPKSAQKTFDDPDTFQKLLNEDRSEVVLAHACKCEGYRRRNLEVTEEFVERYVMEQM